VLSSNISGTSGIVHHILNLGTRWKHVNSFSCGFTPEGKRLQYPWNGSSVDPRADLGAGKEISLTLPRMEPFVEMHILELKLR
jgi:hypothetical protein